MMRPIRWQTTPESEESKVTAGKELQRWRRAGYALLMLGCLVSKDSLSQNRQRPARPRPNLPADSKAAVVPSPPLPSFTQEELQGMQAVLETSQGQIILEFYPTLAPSHVNHFAGLVKSGFYDGTTFHRVILRGIIQGGDPLSKDPAKKSLYGTGGLKKLKPEFSKHPHVRGTVSAVLLPGDPNSAGSQFFICVSDQLQLDGQYTAWGRVVEGMEVVDRISESPAGPDQMAKERIEIAKAFLRPIPPPQPIPFADATVEAMKRHRVRLTTTLGNIEMELFPEKAPETVRNFLKLSKAGLFDDTVWHRIVAGFVVQGGDVATRTIPLTSEQAAKFVKNLPPEFSDLKHEKGSVSMARGEALDSASTSFFICLAPQPTLDGKYTVFGKVVAGLDVVDKMGAVPVFDNEKPKERLDLIRAEVVETR
jgi:cyclophilin family peptidyl-prolyl cis-trans isomerase